MKENKYTIIGFALMALVFVGYMLYSNYALNETNQEEQIEQFANAASEALSTPKVEKSAQPAPQVKKVVNENTPVQDSIFVENDVIKVRISSLGAQIKDVELKDYTKYAPKEERNELVHLFAPESAHFNMTYYLTFEQAFNTECIRTEEQNFQLVSREKFDDKEVVTLRYAVGTAHIDHIYTIYNEKRPERDYMIDFDVRYDGLAPLMGNTSNIDLEWKNRSYQNERSFKNENTYTTIAYHYPGENGIEDLGISEGEEKEDISAPVDWVSFKQQFFSSALIGNETTLNNPILSFTTDEPKSGYIKNFNLQTTVNYTPATTGYDFSFYFGPNKFSILKDLTNKSGKELKMENVIPLGWVLSTFVSRYFVIPVFDFLQKYITNFGLIILILTVLVKLLIFPLTYKSYLSTAKMRVIKPEIDALNAKYPRQEDAMKKQQEMMTLYNKAGINPMGGCLPMLIQMPILIAMFRFFPASIELRGQSFLWSDDLSSYDSILDLPFSIPFYGDHISLFCLLMAIVMFVYSYMNYKQQGSSQPQMAGMMFMTVYMMPIMMLFWFNDYSSGLCYYYLLSNIFTIIQTLIIRLTLKDDKIRAKMEAHAKNTKGKKSRFQQRYEQMLKEAAKNQNK